MELTTLWFILIAVLYTGYFILEGFDLGVGILLPFIGKNDKERRVILNTIGPHWDGNEVWLITAGGATFAAFPIWYATLFSGLYIPLLTMLLALIVRGVAFEFRSKKEGKTWRNLWDQAIFFGSLIPSILWGVVFTNFLLGLPIDSTGYFVGSLGQLLSPTALLGGLLSLFIFTFHGALFLSLKTNTPIKDQSQQAGRKLWFPTIFFAVLCPLMIILSGYAPKRGSIVTITLLSVMILGVIMSGLLLWKKRNGLAFVLTALVILCATAYLFINMYPNLVISSLGPEYNLTIQNAASSPYTLRVMSVIALSSLPILIAYQGWSYWLFRKRLTIDEKDLEY